MQNKFITSGFDNGVDNRAFHAQENDFIRNNSLSTDTANATQNEENSRKENYLMQTATEALPRLENYRHSKKTAKRPSLGELHGQDDNFKDKFNRKDSDVVTSPNYQNNIKLGWIQGVLIPCLLNIWGVMLFLRLSWVVAEAGIGLSLVIIGISAIVCIITTLSLSALCTNGEVKGGGMYYIISRSLGPEFGASVGIVFAFANAVSASMNTIGFCNSLNDLFGEIIGTPENDARIIGTVAIFVMILICAVGMDWESKVQNFLVVTIIAAMVDFLMGTILGPRNDEQKARGFVGFSVKTFSENWGPMYRRTDEVDYGFFQVFAIFFPSVTGIQAGANISGDLKDPTTAIPKGTFLSLLISMISYALFVVFAGGAALRDTSVYESAVNTTFKYGLFNSTQMMQIMSLWEPLIYAGCFAATLSTALTNLLSVPRLIQALGLDKIYPGLIYFSKGYGKHGEPYRGYVLTFVVSVVFLLIAKLNAIAPLISNFYLASYALVNFCTFHAALIKPLGWRPTFKYYNKWLSLFGFILCVAIMFLINWWSSVITFILILGLYLLVVYRKPGVNWGSSTQAQIYKTALTTAQKLTGIGEHVKNYKPQILLLRSNIFSQQGLVEFAYLITKNNSLLIVGEIEKTKLTHRKRSFIINNVYNHFKNHKIKAFYSIIDNMNYENGARAFLQVAGIGKLKPNVLMIGYNSNWMQCSQEDLLQYFNVLHAAFEHHVSVMILRTKHTETSMEEGHSTYNIEENMLPNSTSIFRNALFNNMIPTDSNLSLTNREIPENNSVSDLTLHEKPTPKTNDSDTSDDKKSIEKILPLKGKGKRRIDVWWLYDDGGLTVLIPYIISTRNSWSNCNLRIFGLTTNSNDVELEEKNMANLLSKFRLEYSSLKMVSIYDKPQSQTIDFFKGLLAEYKDHNNDGHQVMESELTNLQDKTFRQLRLRELLLEESKDADLIVMSLPMPRKGSISAPLYMAWLEALTREMPPFLLVRGNQQSVLTVYS